MVLLLIVSIALALACHRKAGKEYDRVICMHMSSAPRDDVANAIDAVDMWIALFTISCGVALACVMSLLFGGIL